MTSMNMMVCRAAPVSVASGCWGGEAAGTGSGPGVPLHLPHCRSLPLVSDPLCQQPGPARCCRPCSPSHGCSRSPPLPSPPLPSPPLPSCISMCLAPACPCSACILYELACIYFNTCWCDCACLPTNTYLSMFCFWLRSCCPERKSMPVSSMCTTMQAQAAVHACLIAAAYQSNCGCSSQAPYLL